MWKEVKGYENLYEVNENGIIKLKKAYKGKNYYFISIEEYNKLKAGD